MAVKQVDVMDQNKQLLISEWHTIVPVVKSSVPVCGDLSCHNMVVWL